MDGRPPERGSRRGPESGAAPKTPKTRRELRAEREAAERAQTASSGLPLRPQPVDRSPGTNPTARQKAPAPWDVPEPEEAPSRRPERPERGPLAERFPARPTPLGGVGGMDLGPAGDALTRPPARRDPDDFDAHDSARFDAHDDDHEPHRAADPRRRRRVGLWLTAVALLLALWTATVFVDSLSPFVSAPSALAPLVTICALPVIAIGVGGKHFISTGIAALAALLPWAMVAGYASSRDLPAGTTDTVRVMTVDGNHGRASASDVVGAATDYSADVVIVTGLSTTLAHELTVSGLSRNTPPVWMHVSGDQTDGIGIWSRLTISGLAEAQEYDSPVATGVLEVNKARVGLTVAQLSGSPLRPGPGWRADLTRLSQQRVEGATSGSFLVGSLNVAPWQPGFRMLEKAGWEDAADITGKGLRPTWPSWSPLPITPADHVLVDEKLGVGSTATATIGGSSHRAIVAALEVPAG
ncbi:endonuclease/exonuclease/phosphatase family protein [Kineosporia sp. NBRC 101731]|uniref:endonuclease/exonuclease/phosphatase family protein n=1 Tax=Kineosporia sp. NBRC 101731 TaxID=3032199 RepID=UPI0024A5F91C|nr:endonuclease/exonuclease/phosphatase family protein [Kineosporia sp. NBRC 101731]GLY27847.1 hypothetical protein Kisp02_12120 [Kineosporia sp. NBRC 101731]